MKLHAITVTAAFAATVLGGYASAQTTLPANVGRALVSVTAADIAAVPAQPKPFAVPAQPIVAASSDGYLPSSWDVNAKGAFALTLPLAVPPGRAGMVPEVSLSYASGNGNGVAGVGWSISGFSTITRGGRVWARDGATDGVDFTVRDRFYLDGQELVGVTATPYGGNGAEYRTEPDTFVRVHSTSAQALDPEGPEQFTVELGDGRTRTYAPVTAEQVTFDDANDAFTHAPVRVEWREISEADASGNTITCEYQDQSGPGGLHASDYWIESVPSAIRYTANLTGGLPTHGLQDLPQRAVVFEYEPRSDATSGWQAGVQKRRSLRLKTIRMDAPDPAATDEVWRYTLSYVPGGSQRSLLASVQRCENVGGCLWAKQFTYAPSTTGALFQSQPVIPAAISKTDYDLSAVAAPDGEAPAMQLPDLNGDGASDLVFGAGTMQLWETKHYGAPFNVSLADGNFLGKSHTLWLSERDANGAIVPFAQSQTLARDEDPLATANYGHVRLDEATVVDLDGDGHDELVATIDNLGSREVNVDPNLPPLYYCSYADLKWTGASFVHTHAVPCTPLGVTNGSYKYYDPGEFPTFADFDGDGLPDRAWPYNRAGWTGSNQPKSPAQYKYDPAWKLAFNDRGQPGSFGPPVQLDQFDASPGVVTDLDGDGRAELTSESVRSSLTLDDSFQWVKQTPDSIHQPVVANAAPFEGYREFGDFNGDGTEDLLRLTAMDPSRPGTLTAQIFWNTGKGFYADSHARTVPVDVHPDVALKLSTRFTDPGIHMTDLDNDGRMDVVIFNNDHRDANNQPAPQIVFLFSQGDGTFGEVDLPVSQPGTRDDVKYWLDNSLRPTHVYPGRLEFDEARLVMQAYGQFIPGAGVLLSGLPFENYVVVGGNGATPGLAAGWNLATLADTNGDGAIDIVRHVGGNSPSGGFEVLQQIPHDGGDELIAVTDAATAWPVLSIDYSNEWSDAPESNDSYVCAYPLRCPRTGLRVVRAVTSRQNLTDLAPGDDPLAHGHTWKYAYRDPIVNQQGLGFFGFSEMDVWDTAPEHPVETITTFDLRTPDASGRLHPGVGVPATVTVAQPILDAPGQPAQANARMTRSDYTYEFRALNGGATHAVLPAATSTSVWEQAVAVSWSGQGPDHRHVSGYAEPAQPTIHVDTQVTVDDFGQVTDTITDTAGGLKTDVATPRIEDTVNWHLGLVRERSTMTLENAKNAVPTWQTTDFTYTSRGQLESVTTEPNSGDPALQSTTTLAYDDYGLPTSATTTVAGEAPRTRHLGYANLWPGAPDEHLFASSLWADHANPQCGVDCRPAAWVLTHPAYGLPIATMNVDGVETQRVYDGHGRPVGVESDGALPVTVTYAGRPDTFGGMNGLDATATVGLQELLRTFDAAGRVLRTSFVGFDGQWINTFATYDPLGRESALSRPGTGSPAAWTTWSYDTLGRTIATHFADGSQTASTYELLRVTHTDAAAHVSHQDYDVDGRLVTSGTALLPTPPCGVCLAKDVQTTYAYAATPVGAVARAFDDQGHVTTTQYDRLGRPVQQDDPSTGTTTVAYNGFGEPKQTVHAANGEMQTETCDDLGRVLTTTTPDGLTTYTWDVATNGIGRLARAMSPDQIKTEYRFDNLGRVAGLDQTDETQATASVDLAYDAQTGRLASIDYPEIPGSTRMRAAYAYNGYGYLTTVSDATPGGSGTVWQSITARNADLALVDATRGIDAGVGGGAIDDHRDYDPLVGRLWTIRARHAGTDRLDVSYNYDPDGLVQQRTTTDETVQIDETFAHDALHRLTHVTRNGMPLQAGLPFATSIDESYDSVGNRIDTLRNGQLVEHRSYGSNGQQPYALTERDVTDPANPNQPPVAQHYQYDALGRLKQDPHRIFTWTAFDLPSSVAMDGTNWTFRYNADHERVKKSGPGETITYLAGLYEKHVSAQPARHVFHVVGADEVVADVTFTEPAQSTLPGTTTVAYPLTDALGSTNAIADELGTVLQHDYFDAWGQRSNPDGTQIANPTLFQSLFGAGFTNQEHDDDLALIDMHGRLYDPALGRFASADPLVGNPAFSESWNTYSYVNNSPLNFTDPSGFDPCPPGFYCTNGPNNEYTNTIQYSQNTSGELPDTPAPPSAVGAASAISAGLSIFRGLQNLQHEDAVRNGRELSDGTRIRTADGTPILPRRINAAQGNRLEDNWGYPIRRTSASGTGVPANRDSLPIRKAAEFSVRLFCGSKCSEASAPTSAQEAAAAPKQLSNARIARNAVSQVLAARALVKFLGKVGVIIDEGVDGVIDRLMPEAFGALPKTPISTLRTKARYAYAVRAARVDARAAKRFMLDSQVKATSAHQAYLQALASDPATRTIADMQRLADLADAASTAEWYYRLEKQQWYEAVDDLEKATQRFESYIRFGQWEESGLDVPDPETASFNLDPDAY